MVELYFTRHGKTQWNKEGRFQGMYGDSPLLTESYAEIAALGRKIQRLPFAAVYSSTAKRARQTTAGIVQQLQIKPPIFYDDRLREMGYGTLEGQSIQSMLKSYGSQLQAMRYHLDQYDPSAFQGETLAEMLQRMTAVILEAVDTHAGPLLFVGHGTSMTATVQYLAGKPLTQLRNMGGMKNNSLNLLTGKQPRPPYDLRIWNDTSFLPAAKEVN